MLVIYTGGTFGMLDLGQGLESAADLKTVLAKLVVDADPSGKNAQWQYLALERIIDSADADLSHGIAISVLIREHISDARGVVVVHGTDSLAYASAVAAFALADITVPIVFTGSQRPISESGSDAPNNFVSAYREASNGLPGVRIAFGGAVIHATRALKFSSNDDEAFKSFRPVAPDAVGVEGINKQLTELAKLGSRPQDSAAPEVGLIRVFPGFKPALLSAAATMYPDGLVLECYGAGTAPTSTPGFRETVSSITAAGTPIVAITQCQTGSVQLDRYAVGAVLQDAGAWSGYDLTAEAALAKLGMSAALGLDWDERRTAFATNFVGEQHSSVELKS